MAGTRMPDTSRPERGVLLTGLLLLILGGNAAVLALYAANGIVPHLNLGPGARAALVAVPLANIAAAAGIWQWRRWGVYLWVAVSLAAPLVNWLVGAVPGRAMPIALLGSFVGINLVIFLVRRRWGAMS